MRLPLAGGNDTSGSTDLGARVEGATREVTVRGLSILIASGWPLGTIPSVGKVLIRMQTTCAMVEVSYSSRAVSSLRSVETKPSNYVIVTYAPPSICLY